MKSSISQSKLILQYYVNHAKRDVPHSEVVDWASAKWQKMTGKKFRDPDRAVRKLAQEGFLIKVAKGIYKYDSDHIKTRKLEDFTPTQKKEILERDENKCVICGRGVIDGVELHIDHVKAKDYGGQATIDNGQTLCAQHNFLKKNYSQTETGKRVFIRLHSIAEVVNDSNMMDFTRDILDVYDKYGIDSHIN